MAERKSSNPKPRIKYISGHRFGRLLIASYHGEGKWLCECDCGNRKVVEGVNLRSGTTRSCGCLAKELASKRAFKHGLSTTREGKSWNNARLRCFTTSNKDYLHYGGRGITMCEAWAASFERFLADMGPCPDGYTLDRIDNDGNYEPGNCRWSSRATQAKNQRRAITITHQGETLSLYEWSERTGILYGRLYHRLKHNQPLFAPVSTKFNKRKG